MPTAAITIDDLAAIAEQTQHLTQSADPSNDRNTRRIEAIFNGYGIAFNDTSTSREDTSCR